MWSFIPEQRPAASCWWPPGVFCSALTSWADIRWTSTSCSNRASHPETDVSCLHHRERRNSEPSSESLRGTFMHSFMHEKQHSKRSRYKWMIRQSREQFRNTSANIAELKMIFFLCVSMQASGWLHPGHLGSSCNGVVSNKVWKVSAVTLRQLLLSVGSPPVLF